jgi:hypothetical protein
MAREKGRWAVRWRLSKYHEDISAWLASGRDEASFHAAHQPYEVRELDGNLLVNVGIQLLLDKLIGAAGTVFDATNAYVGVGDSTTAAAASQTDLQAATNKLRKGMEATFPSRSGQTMSWKASFGSAEANFAWQEWGIFNASTAGTMLNRKVESLGTKATGTWTLQGDVTIS